MEKHGAGVEEAWRMLDTFASLGADRLDLTLIDLDGHKRSFHPHQSREILRRHLPMILPSAITHQQNVIVRPRGSALELIQLDDLDGMAVERVRTAAFLILATSAGNHQAWLAVRGCSRDWVRRLRHGSGADPSASGATRMAGSVNFKRKYAPQFPSVRLIQMTPHHIVDSAELEALDLVAANTTSRTTFTGQPRPVTGVRRWPSYERCLTGAPPAHNGDRPDVSRADFTFCLLSIDWGWSLADTYQRLLEISSKAHVAGKAYARLTVQRAAAAIDRRQATPPRQPPQDW